jgi:hypothetical protein
VGREVQRYSATGVLLETITTIPDYDSGDEYGAFCRLTPDESGVWVGFTVAGNADDRIYSAPLSGGAPTHEATLPGNYDLEWIDLDGEYRALVSGSDWTANNAVWLLDAAGGNHVKVAEVGGYGSGIAVGVNSDLYAMNQTTTMLYRFDAMDVTTAALGQSAALVADNAIASVNTVFAGSDLIVDGAGTVFFNANDPSWSGACLVGMLYFDAFDVLAFDNVALGSGAWGNWTTQLAFGGGSGGVLADEGRIYVADYYASGGVTVLETPEPAGMTLGLLAMLCVAATRRTKKGH